MRNFSYSENECSTRVVIKFFYCLIKLNNREFNKALNVYKRAMEKPLTIDTALKTLGYIQATSSKCFISLLLSTGVYAHIFKLSMHIKGEITLSNDELKQLDYFFNNITFNYNIIEKKYPSIDKKLLILIINIINNNLLEYCKILLDQHIYIEAELG